jgi:hypothetical protein
VTEGRRGRGWMGGRGMEVVVKEEEPTLRRRICEQSEEE